MSPTTRDLAGQLTGRRIPIDATRAGSFTEAVVADEATGTIRVAVEVSASGKRESWQLCLKLDASDRDILADGGTEALDAYTQTLAVAVAEWWSTGLQTVVVEAHRLP